MGRAARSDRLTPDDWTQAALAAIAQKGTANVSVERIARELGATKGSFYWHFKDRPALIAAALDHWEREYTDRIIERLAGVDDPRARFRGLLQSAFVDHPGVLIDANLLAAADDPVVGAALERVARKRLTFVEQIFAQTGAADAADRALLAFSAYVGLAQLRRTAAALTPHGKKTKGYIDHTVTALFGPAGE
jgi:AcrR family transcriptional regulator